MGARSSRETMAVAFGLRSAERKILKGFKQRCAMISCMMS